MLLKFSQYQKRSRMSGCGKPQKVTGSARVATGKGGHRRGMKNTATKRLNHRPAEIKRDEVEPVVTGVELCDNSNDSGLGFDHHIDYPSNQRINISSAFSDQEYWSSLDGSSESKRRRLEIKLEADDANDNFTFVRQTGLPIPTPSPLPHLCINGVQRNQEMRTGGVIASGGKGGKKSQVNVGGQSIATSRDGKVQLQIISQPEMQHRARYQTEGSRGAVKDRTGNGFPVVKLSGYDRIATLEVYIGTDQGRVAPHMFYQACRVSGKNSTPCVERKVNGTILIQIEFDPSKDMVVTCDCVGILKERNVDVEHRFPEESSARNKKKSTRCRMVFRTTIKRDDGSLETLQVTSQPIVCTQPPGIPEICKKSLSSCPANGGLELFILGKNFLKDTKVMFCEGEPGTDSYWERIVHPDKDFLQQSHLVCMIPAYKSEEVKENVSVRLHVVSGGKSSEPHNFYYSPLGTAPLQVLPQDSNSNARAIAQNLCGKNVFHGPGLLFGSPLLVSTENVQKSSASHTFISKDNPAKGEEESVWGEMMPPPQAVPPRSGELEAPSMATLRRFVCDTGAPLPSLLTVDTYLSGLETKVPTPLKSPVKVTPPPPPPLCSTVSLDPTTFSSTAASSQPQIVLADTITTETLVVPATEPVESRFPSSVLLPNGFTGPSNTLTSPPGENLSSNFSSALVLENEFVSSRTDTVTSSPLPTPYPTNLVFATPQEITVITEGSSGFTSAENKVNQRTEQFQPDILNATFTPREIAVENIVMDQNPTFGQTQGNTSSEDTGESRVFRGELVGNVFNTETRIENSMERQVDTKTMPKPKEEGIPLPQELTQMSEHDLLSYINPSCFDQV